MFFSKKNNANSNLNGSGGLFVIEHDFDNGDLAYKYERENIPLGSVLFVKPGQEAIAVIEGKPTLFRNGRYDENELRSNNTPTAEKLSRPYEKSIFNTYIVFINKDKAIKCYWGTTGPIMFYSERYDSNLRIRARGSYTLVIDNSLKFNAETLGQLSSYKDEDIDNFIFNEVIQVIMNKIASAVQQENIPFSQLTSHTLEISDNVTRALKDAEVFENYGLKLKSKVAIEYMVLDPEDLKLVQEADKIIRDAEMSKRASGKESDARAEAIRKEGFAQADVDSEAIRRKGLAEAEVMRAKGDGYRVERMYDVLQSAAENEGNGANMMNTGMGVGMGAGLGTGFGYAMGNMAGNAFNDVAATSATASQTTACPDCGTPNPVGVKFCQNCGKKLIKENICPDCGTNNPAGAKFCQNCGKKLVTEIVCPDCGTVNAAGVKFCGNCGKKLD